MAKMPMMLQRTDDWFGPDVETGILGHGHDGLVIDRIKHTPAAMGSKEQVAIIVAATIWALQQQAEGGPFADWLGEQQPPESLWKGAL